MVTQLNAKTVSLVEGQIIECLDFKKFREGRKEGRKRMREKGNRREVEENIKWKWERWLKGFFYIYIYILISWWTAWVNKKFMLERHRCSTKQPSQLTYSEFVFVLTVFAVAEICAPSLSHPLKIFWPNHQDCVNNPEWLDHVLLPDQAQLFQIKQELHGFS